MSVQIVTACTVPALVTPERTRQARSLLRAARTGPRLRQGEIDLALARGVRSAPGLRVLPSWSESVFAVVSARHPAAGRAAVGLAELAAGPMRTSQDHDPSVVAALRDAGLQGRPARRRGTVHDTIVEVGSDQRSWTVLPADQAAEVRSTRVRVIPLEPRTTITGSVVVPADLPCACAAAHVAAFGDAEAG